MLEAGLYVASATTSRGLLQEGPRWDRVLTSGSFERKDRILNLPSSQRHAQIVESHDILDFFGVQLGKIHRDVGASGMPHHG